MEGSIADSTSLRIRNQLQRGYDPSLSKPRHGLFEELLKFPVAQAQSAKESDEQSVDQAALPNETPQATSKPSESDSRPADDKVDDDERADDEANQAALALATSVPVAPVPTAEVEPLTLTEETAVGSVVESAVEPSMQLEESETVVDQTAVTSARPIAVSTEPLELTETPAEVTPVVDGQPTSTVGITEEQDVEVENGQLAALTKPDQTVPLKPIKIVEENSAAAVERPNRERRDVADRPESKADQPNLSDAQGIKASAPAESSFERSSRGGGEEPREKWYMADDSQAAQLNAADERADARDENHRTGNDEGVAASENAAQQIETLPQNNVLDAPIDATLEPSPVSSISSTALAAQALMSSSAGGSASDGNANGNGNGSRSSSNPSAAIGGTAAPSTSPQSQSGISNAPERANGDVRELTQQERVRLVQRVARSFSRLGPDGGQITLKLHPPQLGVLNLSVRIEGQTMSARLQTESSAARDAILENLPVLRERLAEQGIDVARFQVDVGNGPDSMADQPAPNSFGGDSSNGARGDRSDVDYRRVSRNSSAQMHQAAAISRSAESNFWQARPLADLTLDIRA